MRYVIVGAGAVGGVIGGRLFAAGLDVVLVARGDNLAALRAHGLELQTPDGTERHAVPAVARLSIAAAPISAYDSIRNSSPNPSSRFCRSAVITS